MLVSIKYRLTVFDLPRGIYCKFRSFPSPNSLGIHFLPPTILDAAEDSNRLNITKRCVFRAFYLLFFKRFYLDCILCFLLFCTISIYIIFHIILFVSEIIKFTLFLLPKLEKHHTSLKNFF